MTTLSAAHHGQTPRRAQAKATSARDVRQLEVDPAGDEPSFRVARVEQLIASRGTLQGGDLDRVFRETTACRDPETTPIWPPARRAELGEYLGWRPRGDVGWLLGPY